MSPAIPVAVAIVRLKWDLHWKPALRYTAWRWWRRLAVYERRVWECWKLSADEKLRARFADGLASPDGAAPSPAQGAAPLHAHTPRHAATRPRQPWDTAQQPVLREPPGLTDAPPDEPEGDPLALWRPYVPYRETWEQWGWPR